MDATRMIQIAVAKADLMLCALMALPWGRIVASIVLAAILIKVVKACELERRNL